MAQPNLVLTTFVQQGCEVREPFFLPEGRKAKDEHINTRLTISMPIPSGYTNSFRMLARSTQIPCVCPVELYDPNKQYWEKIRLRAAQVYFDAENDYSCEISASNPWLQTRQF